MKKFLSFLSIVIFTLISCEESEINLGEESLIENQSNFQVEFDNQIYHADYVEASIVNGVTVIKAYKTSTKEYVVLKLNKDAVGNYTLSPNDNVGSVAYKKYTDDIFNTSPTAFSGRIDLTNIDLQKMKLFGQFSFIGVRMIPAIDNEGNPILDDNDDPTYIEEIKNFTNGIFENIDFSNLVAINPNLEPEPEPTNDTFFVKIDGEEFVETTLFAEKLMVSGEEVIEIRATKNGSNHVFKLQMPANVIFGSSHLLKSETTSPGEDSITSYRINSENETYLPYLDGEIETPILRIVTHDSNTNKIVGTFEFSAKLGNEVETKQFTEGAFSVTYTE